MFERIEVASPEVVSLGRKKQVDSPNDKQHSTTQLIGIVFWLRFCCRKKAERSLSDLDNNFGRNDLLPFEHSGPKDRDWADENVCNKCLVWTPSHMHPSNRALYSFYLHLERGRSSRWERNCQRNSAADEKLFITSHGGEGVYNFRRGLDLGVNFENPQNVIGGPNFKTRDWHSM